MGPGHLVVHLGDHRAAGLERGNEVVGGEAEAMLAARIGRAELDEYDVGADLAGADPGAELRVGNAQDLEHAGVGKRAGVADPAIRAEPKVIRMLWLDDAGVAYAEGGVAARK